MTVTQRRIVEVRAAGPDELDEITRLWVHGARTHLGLAGYAPDLDDARLEREARLWARDYMGNRYGVILLAWPTDGMGEDGEPRAVGILSGTIANRSVLHDDARIVTAGDAYVVPAWRRRGVLTTLVGALEDWSRSRGVGAVVAEFAADNPVAAQAWRRLGYEDEAVRVRKPLHKR